MPLFPPQYFHKTEGIHRQGLAVNRPAAADVLVGTLYHSTDTNVLERSNGAAWISYSGGGAPGPTGSVGPMGMPGLDGIDGENGLDGFNGSIGPRGVTGATGSSGTTGNIGPPGLDAEEPEYPYIIPGAKGDTATGYEVGNWSPFDNSGAGLAITNNVSRYVKIGNYVFASTSLTYPVTANGSNVLIAGLPYTVENVGDVHCGSIGFQSTSLAITVVAKSNTAKIALFTTAGSSVINSQLSGTTFLLSVGYIAA